MNCKYKVTIKRIQYNYKVQMSQLQGKYKFNIFCTGYNDSEIRQKIEDMYNAWPKVTGEGETITLNDTVSATMPLGLKGNTYQEGTPTPDTPQEVHVVSGDNTVEVVGKNLLNASPTSKTFTANETTQQTFGEFNLIAGTKYYVSYNIENATTSNTRNTPYLQIKNTPTRYYESASQNYNLTAGRKVWEFTCPTTDTYQFVYWCHTPNVALTVDNFMISTSSDTTYEPYQSTTYPINLPEGMFMGWIGNYQDYFYKQDKKWYKYGAIGKVVLDGTETWNKQSVTSGNNFYTKINEALGNVNIPLYSNLSVYRYFESVSSNVPQYSSFISSGKNFNFLASRFNGVNDLKAFLETTNMILYYVLATPTATEITYTTLISQLEAIEKAESYTGQTNISQTNEDMPFIITASTLKDLSNL